jgi:hypothetical protein
VRDTARFLKATVLMYADAARAATKDSLRSWPLFVGSVVLYIISVIAETLALPFGPLAGGFLVGLIWCMLIAVYYSWIAAAANHERITFRDLLEPDWSLFSAVISVAFILWIAIYIVQSLTLDMPRDDLVQFSRLGIKLLLALLLNPLAEVVYLRRYESLSAVKYAFSFVQTNWIEWFLPLVILVSPALFDNSLGVLGLLAQSDPLLPALPLVATTQHLPLPVVAIPFTGAVINTGIFAGVILAGWYMLFRAHLFQALESGSRRRRMYFPG